MKAPTYIMQTGRFKGHLIGKVPADYLLYAFNIGTPDSEEALLELERRGYKRPTLTVSGHAVDKASLRLMKQWKKTRIREEGLHSWLERISEEAIRKGTEQSPGKFVYRGIVFVFTFETDWPVLKTIFPKERD